MVLSLMLCSYADIIKFVMLEGRVSIFLACHDGLLLGDRALKCLGLADLFVRELDIGPEVVAGGVAEELASLVDALIRGRGETGVSTSAADLLDVLGAEFGRGAFLVDGTALGEFDHVVGGIIRPTFGGGDDDFGVAHFMSVDEDDLSGELGRDSSCLDFDRIRCEDYGFTDDDGLSLFLLHTVCFSVVS